MAEKSRFVLTFDRSANAVNRLPNLKGEYKLAGEDATARLALWGGVSEKTGKLYARGQATPEGISAALRAKGAVAEVEAPPTIDLKVGEAVVFENPEATKENKWPKFRGYVREATRYVKLSGWEHGNTITGEAELYRPSQRGSAAEGDAPEPT